MDFFLHLGILVSIYCLATLGQNYASGYGGLISLNHGAFMGIAAYTSAALMLSYHFPFWLSLVLAVLLTVVVAFFISFPLLRLKGDSFVLVSFGFSFIAFNVFLNWKEVTNGALGLKGILGPSFFLFEHSRLTLFFVVLVSLAASLWFLRRVLDSSYGTVIKSAREHFTVAQVSGHDAEGYQRSVFVLSSVFAALAGVFLGSFIRVIDPLLFTYDTSVLLLMMAILGGLGSLKGSLAGAALLILVPEVLRFVGFPSSILAESQQIVYGLILIGLLYFRPLGLFGTYRI